MQSSQAPKETLPPPPTDTGRPVECELSVIMPCLNEEETIGTCILKARQAMDRLNILGEIVVGDNGSTDRSREIGQELGARVISVKERGYGSALLGAIQASHGKFIIMGDADDSYDFAGLEPFIEKLRDGYDLVMGNRFKGGIRYGAMPLLHRYLGNPVLTSIGRLFFRSPCGDFHCGLRGFRRDAIKELDLRTTGMEFASEMVVKATLRKMRITEVPTTLSPDGRSRPPHLRSWRDGWRHLRFLLLYSPRWLFLYPGLLLILIGLLVSAWLLPGPQKLGRITFDVHTLIYAAMGIIVGYQAVAFAVFTKIFAISEGLLPDDPRLNRLFRVITLETGLVIGFGLTLIGMIGTLYTILRWSAQSFGPLEYSSTIRIVIPALTCVVVGFQTILSSFFLSVLGMARR